MFPKTKKTKNLKLIIAFVIILPMLLSTSSYAIPNFARQTNISCSTCHYTYPELTPFGRLFKLNGYTATGIATIQSSYKGRTNLNLVKEFPISATIQSSYTHVSKAPAGTKNNTAEFPQELGLYLGGEITPHIGAFVQVSYDDQEAAFGWDMTDIRYANHTTVASKDLLYGFTLNNNPTLEDVWNTTAAEAFPYVGSGVAPGPDAGVMIGSDALANQVVGLGAYSLYNNFIYGNVSLYSSTPQGGVYPPDNNSVNTIKGLAPYWRFALQRQFGSQYLEVGTYGMSTELYPIGISGKTDKYTDVAFDAQYEKTFAASSLIAHTTYINETRNLDYTFANGGVTSDHQKLNTFKVDLNYNIPQGLAFMVGYFNINGDKDPVYYATRTGSPNSSGVTLQVTFIPWLNTQFAIQYVAYSKFNGSSRNYDGSGRNASDNNTIYMNSWLMF